MYLLTKLLSLALLMLPLASPSFAADEVGVHGIYILNSLLFLIGGFLVMFMAAGFCMLEAGLVRAKNTTTQLTKNIAFFSLAAVGYYLIGYNLMYPLGSWAIGWCLLILVPSHRCAGTSWCWRRWGG